MSEAKKNDSGMGKLTLTLGAICAVCALALGVVNEFTEPLIAQVQEEKKVAAISAEVMPGFSGSITPVNYTGSDTTIRSVQKAGEDGFIVEVTPSGSFSGTLKIMVGVSNDKTVTGISILESGETAGLGDRASEPEFREQYVGKSGDAVQVTKDGGEINAISGATITSRAVSSGVLSAIAAVDETNDDPYVPVEDPAGGEEEPEELAIPDYTGELTAMDYTGSDETVRSISKAGDAGYVVEVAVNGYSEEGPVVMQVGVAADGTVANVLITESHETPGLGARASEPDFRGQFAGKSGEVALTENGGEIDALSGATITSAAVVQGVNSALAAVAELG